MSFTRRQFLATTGAAAGAYALASARANLASARGLLIDSTLDTIIGVALASAKKAGASYADVRIVRRRSEEISAREGHVAGSGARENYGIGVRVIANGAWGFAATSRVEPGEADRVATLAVDIAKANAKVLKTPVTLAPTKAYVDVWQTPLTKDPFLIPLEDKAELLVAITAKALETKGVKFCGARYEGTGEWKVLATSEGAYLEQSITRLNPGYRVTAVDPAAGEFVTRSHEIQPRQAGWEYIENTPLLEDVPRIAEDAIAKLKAPGVEPGKKDLILAPTNLWLTIHESVGHPTELDRALGYEANFAGTSFATPDKLGKLKYGSELMTIFADKVTPGGMATCGYDDDGVKTQKWDLVKDGKFVGYQTTRDEAGWIGEKESRGTSYAQDFANFPFQRMPNVSLAPGAKDLGVADLIAATDDGIYITGNGSWSIDHQRLNFQFGGQMFYEIKKGKITHPLRDVAYQANTLDFWSSLDMVGGQREWTLGAAANDGKGEPEQINPVSHGCAPSRFKKVNILNTNQRKGS